MEQIANACSEMNFILENLESDFSSRIPEKIKNFFKNNKSNSYKVNLVTTKPLYEQDLLEETKIYIQIIYKLFIAPKTEKEKYIAESRKMFVTKNAERWLENNNK